MKKVIIILIVLTLCSCLKNNEKDKKSKVVKTFTITAKIDGLNEDMTVVLNRQDDDYKIDENITFKGGFRLSATVSDIPQKYGISIMDSLKKISNIILWAKNNNILITGKLKNNYIQNILIEGQELNNIEKKYNDIIQILDSPEINKEIESANNQDNRNAIISKYMNLYKLEQIKFIYKNPNNFVSLTNIFSYKYRISKDSLQLYYDRLDTVLQNSKKGKILKKIISIKKLKVGDSIQDFKAYDIKGNLVKLSDFKGKIILLDFWASWCVPCHLQNQKEFSYLHLKYKNQGLIIISYSLDKKSAKKAWEKASKKDNINWINISNLKGFNDPVAVQYNINTIPNSFLINPNGIIVKSFIGYDKNNSEIEKGIKKLLN